MAIISKENGIIKGTGNPNLDVNIQDGDIVTPLIYIDYSTTPPTFYKFNDNLVSGSKWEVDIKDSNGNINIRTDDNSVGSTGNIIIRTGEGDGGAGNIEITAGYDGGYDAAGRVIIKNNVDSSGVIEISDYDLEIRTEDTGNTSSAISITTGNSSGTSTGGITIKTGNATDDFSGEIVLETGSGDGISRIAFRNGSEGTINNLWTSVDTQGGGEWKTLISILSLVTGYNGAATQTLKHVSGVLQWVTD